MQVVPIPPHETAVTPMLPGMQEWLDGQRTIKMVKAREGGTPGDFSRDFNIIYDRGRIVELVKRKIEAVR